MADRIPLILNTNANQIQEMPSGDTLDLTNSNINGVGVLTATTFKGDGSQLTGVVQSDTPVGSSNASTTFYEMDKAITVSTDTTLSRASSNPGIIYTKFQEVEVAATKSLIVDAGEVLVVNTYNLSS